nr:uncharacterized protein LOC105468786 [Macaca nemestrina]
MWRPWLHWTHEETEAQSNEVTCSKLRSFIEDPSCSDPKVTILNPSPCGVFPILNVETAVQWQEKDLQSHTDVASLMTPDGLACLPLGLRHHILRKPKLHAEATIDVLANSPSFSCQTYE